MLAVDKGVDVKVLLSWQYLFMVVYETTGVCVCARMCACVRAHAYEYYIGKFDSSGNRICIFNKKKHYGQWRMHSCVLAYIKSKYTFLFLDLHFFIYIF